eukprot:1460138-Rhodomonas_salina.3
MSGTDTWYLPTMLLRACYEKPLLACPGHAHAVLRECMYVELAIGVCGTELAFSGRVALRRQQVPHASTAPRNPYQPGMYRPTDVLCRVRYSHSV